MTRQKIIIIVVNYGTIDLIKNLINGFLASLPKYPRLRMDWIVADAEDKYEQENDTWQSAMKKEFKDKLGNHFHFFKIPNNGFAANVNLGFRLFKESRDPEYRIKNSDLVLLLNPDTFLYWANLEKAISFMNSHFRASVAGMALTNPKGQPEKWGHSTSFPTLKFIGRKRFSEPSGSSEPTKVAWVSGGAMMIKYVWWQKLRGLDGNFFFYFEDVDFCKRIKDAGGKVYFLPQATVNHLRGGSNISIYKRKKHYYAAEARYFHLYRSPSEYLSLRLIRIPYKIVYFVRCYFAPFFWKNKFRATKEYLNCERKDGYPNFCAFKTSFLSIPFLKEIWLAAILFNLIILGAAIWARFSLFTPLVLHYNAYLGIDLYGDTSSFFMFPLLAFLITILNFILGIVLFFSKRYTPFVILPAGASLAFLVTLSIALLNLLMVNS